MILGHLVGDYLFQHRWMGMTKTENSPRGYLACFLHCLVYSLIVAGVMYPALGAWRPCLMMAVIAFVCHFPIDKFSLARFWRAFTLDHHRPYLTSIERVTARSANEIVLWWFTYIVTDNTMHLGLMTIGIFLFLPELV